MAPLLLELSSLDVEPLEVVVPKPESEQDSSLDTLATPSVDDEALAVAISPLPVAACPCCGCTCCCCSPVTPCCCCL